MQSIKEMEEGEKLNVIMLRFGKRRALIKTGGTKNDCNAVFE